MAQLRWPAITPPSFLGSLLLDRDTALTPIGRLSGGERSRVQIGGLILGGANFLERICTRTLAVGDGAVIDFAGPTSTIDVAGHTGTPLTHDMKQAPATASAKGRR